jgi:hypothetical protein
MVGNVRIEMIVTIDMRTMNRVHLGWWPLSIILPIASVEIYSPLPRMTKVESKTQRD